MAFCYGDRADTLGFAGASLLGGNHEWAIATSTDPPGKNPRTDEGLTIEV